MTSKAKLERIKRRYNAEFDLIPNGPPVTWATRELVDVIEALFQRVEDLEAQTERLERLRDIDRREA